MGCDVTYDGPDKIIPNNLITDDRLKVYNLRYNEWGHYEIYSGGVWRYIFSDFITDVSQIPDLIFKAGYNNAVGTIRQQMDKFLKK